MSKVLILSFKEVIGDSLELLASSLGSMNGSADSLLGGSFFILDKTTRDDALIGTIQSFLNIILSQFDEQVLVLNF